MMLLFLLSVNALQVLVSPKATPEYRILKKDLVVFMSPVQVVIKNVANGGWRTSTPLSFKALSLS